MRTAILRCMLLHQPFIARLGADASLQGMPQPRTVRSMSWSISSRKVRWTIRRDYHLTPIPTGGNVNITDDDGDTPLYTVENIETARFLVEHGAVVEHRNNEGVSVSLFCPTSEHPRLMSCSL